MSMAALRWARAVRGISSTQKFVLVMLADAANDYGECWPSAITLAEDCCLSEKAVREAFGALEQAGLLVGQHAKGRATRWCIQIGIASALRSASPAGGSGTPERGSVLPDRSASPKDPGTTFRPTPEPASGPPRNVVPTTPERGSDRTLINPHITPIEPSVERAAPRRGSRLPADWKPSPGLHQFAKDEGLDPDRIAASFRDYWHARPGAGGVKLDWDATFRGWCRREADRKPPARPDRPEYRNGFLAMIDRERRGEPMDLDDEPNPFLALEAPHRGH